MRRIDEPKLYQSEIFHWTYEGDTALHLAAAGYRIEIVRLLLAAGADPNAAMNHRRSGPLHYAADGYINGPAWDAKRQVKTIRCLLEAGANVHAQDKNGAAPLHRAVRTRCAAAVQYLLQAGADPTRRNKPGSTPFHLAVSRRVKPSGDRRVKTSHLRKDRFDLQVFWRLLPRKEARSGESTQDGENSGDTLVTRARLDTDPHRGDLAGKSRNGPKVPAATVVRPKTAKRADRLGRLKTARFAERPGSGIKTSKRADRLTG
jgi:hypothetical protein